MGCRVSYSENRISLAARFGGQTRVGDGVIGFYGQNPLLCV